MISIAEIESGFTVGTTRLIGCYFEGKDLISARVLSESPAIGFGTGSSKLES